MHCPLVRFLPTKQRGPKGRRRARRGLCILAPSQILLLSCPNQVCLPGVSTIPVNEKKPRCEHPLIRGNPEPQNIPRVPPDMGGADSCDGKSSEPRKSGAVLRQNHKQGSSGTQWAVWGCACVYVPSGFSKKSETFSGVEKIFFACGARDILAFNQKRKMGHLRSDAARFFLHDFSPSRLQA